MEAVEEIGEGNKASDFKRAMGKEGKREYSKHL